MEPQIWIVLSNFSSVTLDGNTSGLNYLCRHAKFTNQSFTPTLGIHQHLLILNDVTTAPTWRPLIYRGINHIMSVTITPPDAKLLDIMGL